jgi:hypothetical protein
MEDQAISQLPSKSSLSLTDVFSIVDNVPSPDVTKKIAVSVIDARYIPTFNVKTYGAKGDTATDDTAAIQAAIAAAQLVGGRVYLPQGRYKITSPLIITQPISFAGDGPAVTQFLVTGNFGCLQINAGSATTISHLYVGDFAILASNLSILKVMEHGI